MMSLGNQADIQKLLLPKLGESHQSRVCPAGILLKESCLTIKEVKTKSGEPGKRVCKELAGVADPIQRIINKCVLCALEAPARMLSGVVRMNKSPRSHGV